MKLLDIVHPAAKTLVDISLSQDAEVKKNNASPFIFKITLFFFALEISKFTPIPFLKKVGDGTTSVVLIAGEILKNCKPFVEDNVHPQIIVRGLRRAAQLALAKLEEISVQVKKEDPE